MIGLIREERKMITKCDKIIYAKENEIRLGDLLILNGLAYKACIIDKGRAKDEGLDEIGFTKI